MDLSALFNPLALVLVAIAAVLLLWWCRMLRGIVEERTAALSKANLTLTAHAGRLSDLYDNAPCGYHALDAHGIFVEINETELKWLGCNREQVIGKLGFADFLEAGRCRRVSGRWPRADRALACLRSRCARRAP